MVEKRNRIRILSSILWILIILSIVIGLITLSPYLPNFTSEFDQRIILLPLIFLALILVFIYTRSINIRTKKLQAISESIGNGDFSKRSQDKVPDTLGKLSRSVNVMADRIELAIGDLETSKMTLAESKDKLEEQNKELSSYIEQQQRFGVFLESIQSIQISDLAESTTKVISEVSNCHLCAVYSWNDKKSIFTPLSVYARTKALRDRFSKVVDSNSFIGETLDSREWKVLENLPNNDAPSFDISTDEKIYLNNLYAVPIRFSGNILGACLIMTTNKVGTTMRTSIDQIVDATSNALSNAMGYQSIQKQTKYLENINEQLQRSEKAKSEFLANMSHELRTPLNSIIGFSTILGKNKLGNLEDADLNRLEKINRNGKHLLNLINEILDLSKIESGKMDFIIEETDISIVVEDVLEMLAPQSQPKGIELKQKFSQDVITYPLDGSKLKQILINLVSNAIKFTSEGAITVNSYYDSQDGEGALIIDVIDNGIGIPKDKLEAIFDPFSQADASTSRQYGGTGLGLSIARSFSVKMGGSLIAFSEEGKGSTFRLKFEFSKLTPEWKKALPKLNNIDQPKPLSDSIITKKNTRTKPIPKPTIKIGKGAPKDKDLTPKSILSFVSNIEGERILIIEKEPFIESALAQTLDENKALYKTCRPQSDLSDLILTFKPSHIFFDCLISGLDSWIILESLKLKARTKTIPTYIFGQTKEGSLSTIGQIDILYKPISKSDFYGVLERSFPKEDYTNQKILMIDDFVEFHDIFRDWMGEKKNNFHTASNGKEALEKLKEITPDIIFLDLLMPVMDGFEFLSHLREQDNFKQTKIVLITGKKIGAEDLQRLTLSAIPLSTGA